jgi:hypothetical protein
LKDESDIFECEGVNVWLVSGGVDRFRGVVETSDSGTGPEPGWSINGDLRVEEDETWN